MEFINKTFKTFLAAFNYAEVNSTKENVNFIQIVCKEGSHFYSANSTGCANVDETIVCTFAAGVFFSNIDNSRTQFWLNDLSTKEISNLCFESFGRSDWGNITDDQMTYLYLKTLTYFSFN